MMMSIRIATTPTSPSRVMAALLRGALPPDHRGAVAHASCCQQSTCSAAIASAGRHEAD
jgi:hypothetical protein